MRNSEIGENLWQKIGVFETPNRDRVELRRAILGELQTNSYMLKLPGSLVIIDLAGGTVTSSTLQRVNHDISVVFTHLHPDHVAELRVPKVRYFAHELEFKFVREYQVLGKVIGISTCYPENIEPLDNLEGLLPDFVQLIHTPGHTPGSISVILHLEVKILICGDLLFAEGVGRTDLPGGSLSELKSSIKRVSQLPPDTLLLPGHGPIVKLGDAIDNLRTYHYFESLYDE